MTRQGCALYQINGRNTYKNVSIDTMLAFLFCTRQPSEGLGSKAFWRLFCFLPFA
jgi:hypothetical protein